MSHDTLRHESGRGRRGVHPFTLRFLGLVALVATLPWVATAQPVPAESTSEEPLDYVERLLGGASGDDPLPMIVAIHGLGDQPESFAGLFSDLDVRARLILPKAPNPYPVGSSWFPLRPAEETAAGVRRSEELLAELLRSLVESKPTVGNPIVTGFSQGGTMSFALAVSHPDEVSAAAPVSGSLAAKHPEAPPDAPPIRALHGTEDRVMRFEWAVETVEGLRQKGWDVELERFEGVGHAIPSEMQKTLYERLRAAVAALDGS